MSNIILRPYQQEWAQNITNAWRQVRSVLAVLPTAGGKTVVFSHLMHEHTGACAAVVHRKEIVGQISLALGALDVPHRIIAPSPVVSHIRRRHLRQLGRSWVDPHALAGVVSVQTLTSQGADKNRELQNWVGQVTKAVFDEGHHYVKSGFWARAVKRFERAKLLFVTATPQRLDGKGLGAHAAGFADAMVEGPSIRDLIDLGYASSYRYLAPPTDFDGRDIPVTASGELDVRELRRRVVESHLVGDVVEHYQTHTPSKQAIVFASDIETAGEITERFIAAGIRAALATGKTDIRERDRIVDQFARGDLQVVTNVDLFDEGLDIPGASVVIIARLTESLAKYLQMIGRVLRPVYAPGHDMQSADGRRKAMAAGNKPHAIVLDAVRNYERHGLPDWPRVWSLDSRIRGARTSAGEALRCCLECTQPYPRYLNTCPYCGYRHIPEGRARIEQVDGDLIELDVDGQREMFERIRRANLPRDEYAQDQIARHIPPIGRGPDMRRHLAVMERRKVLQELIAWWIGLQPDDRPLSEKHRRFYLRFGVDIGTAHTLKLTETDELIQRIGERFHYDLPRTRVEN